VKCLKLKNNLKIPIIALGTCLIGGDDYGPPDYSKDEEYIKLFKQAIKLGLNHIDTAEMYGGNHTEELIGEAINGFDRKKLFITTKVSPQNLKYEDLINSAKNSLKRLGTDYIDLYLLHRPNPEIPIGETMKAMEFLVDNKLVKSIGVSFFNIEELKEAQKYCKYPIVVNQLKFSLWKASDIKTIKYCQENNIVVMAYKVFGRGKLTTDKIPFLEDLSKKYKKTSAQIILNWVVSRKNTVAIFKSCSINHIKESKQIFDFKLDKKDLEILDSMVPDYKENVKYN